MLKLAKTYYFSVTILTLAKFLMISLVGSIGSMLIKANDFVHSSVSNALG